MSVDKTLITTGTAAYKAMPIQSGKRWATLLWLTSAPEVKWRKVHCFSPSTHTTHISKLNLRRNMQQDYSLIPISDNNSSYLISASFSSVRGDDKSSECFFSYYCLTFRGTHRDRTEKNSFGTRTVVYEPSRDGKSSAKQLAAGRPLTVKCFGI